MSPAVNDSLLSLLVPVVLQNDPLLHPKKTWQNNNTVFRRGGTKKEVPVVHK